MIEILSDWKSKKIAILGAGIEGLATKKFLDSNRIESVILDEKNSRSAFARLGEFDIVVRSPSVLYLRPEIQKFKENGGIVTSQIKIFLELCPSPVIGVTGTKGKGTTSSLIYEMLLQNGQDAYLGGNIGTPPLNFLDKLSKDSIVVLELSSFQLQDIQKSPHIAVMLMTTSEHLDYHKDIAEYVDAKRNIFRFQNDNDFAIVNRDYPASNESDLESPGKVYYISREREGKDGVFFREGIMWMQTEGKEKKIIDTKDILLPGKHNWENAAAAVMAAHLGGVGKDDIVNILKTFKGLEHRLELVGDINGVRFYDDSFSTTPETAIAAIEAFDAPEILILGGSGKNSDFTELGRVISNAKNIKAVIGIGDEWHRMRAEFPISNFQFPIIEDAKDMRTIVLAASKIAKSGDVVLLSPACASFGMFKNYKDRGQQFKKEVKKLASN